MQENDQWEWRNLYYLSPPFLTFVHKYMMTLLVAVDFIMYTCIQQRLYEIFLEEGLEGIRKYMKDLEYFESYTDAETADMNRSRVERLNAFSKLVAAPSKAGNIDKAFTKSRRKERNIKYQTSVKNLKNLKNGKFAVFSRLNSFGFRNSSMSSGKSSEKKKKNSNDSVDRASALSAAEDTSSEGGEQTESDDEGVSQKKRVWDLINEGQPSRRYLLANVINNIICIPLHLKRSRSKLMEAKRMASRKEIKYLSATHGLTFNKDSSLCFELLSWRRSSLVVLVIFGCINLIFGSISFEQLTKRKFMNEELNFYAPLNRFPIPGYVDDKTLEVSQASAYAIKNYKFSKELTNRSILFQ